MRRRRRRDRLLGRRRPGRRGSARVGLDPRRAPGFAGASKAHWQATLDARFGADGWRLAHVVRGAIVSRAVALAEYEEAYRIYLTSRPALVRFLVTTCGNVYDDQVANVHDDDYDQPHTAMNHYQDISVRRVIAGLVDDPGWPDVVATPDETVELIDLGTGARHRVPRARGFRGGHLLQIREPTSPGLLPQPGRRPGPRPEPHRGHARPHGVVPPRGLWAPLGRGVLAGQQGHRGPLRPVPGARRRPRRRPRGAATEPVTGGTGAAAATRPCCWGR